MVYVQADFTPSLPDTHESHVVYCTRCKTSDVNECDAYHADDGKVVAFRSDYNIMSNFLMCKVVCVGKEFQPTEHAFQWRKCTDCKS